MKSPSDYMTEIGNWADIMFPVHLPEYGIVEEIGEITHCILKRRQKIRDMDKDEVFFPKLKDGFADTLVYLLHLCHIYKVAISFDAHRTLLPGGGGDVWSKTTDRTFIAAAIKSASTLLDYCEYAKPEEGLQSNLFMIPCQKLCNTLFLWANRYEINLIEELERTWNKVQKRDWSKDRSNAATNELA